MYKEIKFYTKNNDGRFVAGYSAASEDKVSDNWAVQSEYGERVYYIARSWGEAVVKRARNSKKWVGTIVKNGLGTGDTYFDTLKDAQLHYQQ